MRKRSSRRAKRSPDAQDNLAYRVAELHYVHRESQRHIAKELRLSTAMVSRLLRRAKQGHLIQVTLSPPENLILGRQLEQRLHAYGVRKVMVTAGEGRTMVGNAAARFYEATAPPSVITVLDGGWTVRDLVEGLARDDERRVTIIPVAADPPSYLISAYELMTSMKSKCVKGKCAKLPHLTNLTGSPILKQIHDRIRKQALRADFVFLGVGPWEHSYTALDFVVHLGFDSAVLKKEYPFIAAVCGYFPLAADGTLIVIDELERRMPHALGFQDLRKLASAAGTVVAVLATTAQKCKPLLAAIRARLCNTLILDQPLAAELCKELDRL